MDPVLLQLNYVTTYLNTNNEEYIEPFLETYEIPIIYNLYKTGIEHPQINNISSVVDYYCGLYYSINYDETKMIKNMEISKKCGNVNAMRFLGEYYEKIDAQKMVFCYIEAIAHDDIISMRNLGFFYLNKYLTGVSDNNFYAIRYLKMAADKNDSDSLINMGNIYYKENNHKKAFKYWILGAYYDATKNDYVLKKIQRNKKFVQDYYQNLITFIKQHESINLIDIHEMNVINIIARLIIKKRILKHHERF